MTIAVLSPGNSNHDLVTKKDLYQKFSVQENWVVTLATKETMGFVLKNGIIRSLGVIREKFVLLFCITNSNLTLPLNDFFQSFQSHKHLPIKNSIFAPQFKKKRGF